MLTQVLQALYATAIWLVTIFFASFVTSAMGRRLDFDKLPFIFQITLLSISSILIFLLKVEIPLFKPSPFLLIGVLAVPLSYIANAYALRYDFQPPFIPKDKALRTVLLTILAPLSEELNFRGLYECLIEDPFLSIILPSVTFGLLHYAPYSSAPKELREVEVLIAITLGFVLSIVLKVGGLVPSVIFHSLANVTALLVEKVKGLEPS